MKNESMKSKYINSVKAELKKQFGLKNDMQVPRVLKAVVNVGVGKIAKENDKIEEVVQAIADITGQKPSRRKTSKSISGFKLRQGMEIGVAVTLRGNRMWQFLDRLVNVSLPRTRDFQGIDQKAVDATGNINIGIKEHIIFPEIVPEKVKYLFGFQVTVVTNATNKESGTALFRLLGFPIKK